MGEVMENKSRKSLRHRDEPEFKNGIVGSQLKHRQSADNISNLKNPSQQ